MVKVGQIELKGDIVEIPIEQLVEDVPVNERHVKELCESLKTVGQISPLVVWSKEYRLIDGFHRAGGMKLIGMQYATCIVYDCDEETFWNLRILNAVTHRSVHFSRIVEWVNKAFAGTHWAEKMRVAEAFSIGNRGAAVHIPLTPKERGELTTWVIEKSRLWNLSPKKIRDMLKLAQLADSKLIDAVRDESVPGSFTRSMLELVVKIPQTDLQRALLTKVRTEKLSLKDVSDLVTKVLKVKTLVERERLLQSVYVKPKRSRPSSGAFYNLQALRAKIITEALEQINVVLPQLDQPQSFDQNLIETLAVVGIYFGGEDLLALEILQKENRSLKSEVQVLSDKLQRREQDMDGMRRTMGSMQQEIDNLRRRD